jgi:hypothetical protein
MSTDTLFWIVIAHVAGFWLLLFYVFRLKKRLRCLGYCYIDIGDWGMGRVLEAKDYYISQHGEHVTPFLLLEAEDQFRKKLAYHRQLFAATGQKPPGTREMHYPVEDLI